MKNLLFGAAACLFVATAFGQIRVDGTTGYTTVGEVSPANAVLDVRGDAIIQGKSLIVGNNGASTFVEVGGNRTANGSAGFNFYTTPNAVGSGYISRLAASAGGTTAFSHYGSSPLRLQTLSATDILLRTDGTTRMTIQSTGEVDINGPATVMGGIAVTSDARLKTDVTDFNTGLNAVLQMNPIKYSYTGKANTYTGRQFVGLFAQDLQKIAPEFVSEHQFIEEDEEGRVIEEATYLKIHDSELKFILINAIKELSAEVESLKAQLGTQGNSGVKNIPSSNIAVNLQGNNEQAVLGQNVPNPFAEGTKIEYFVPAKANVAKLVFTDINGNQIKSVSLEKGLGNVDVNVDGLSSGVYSYTLIVDGIATATKKMIIE